MPSGLVETAVRTTRCATHRWVAPAASALSGMLLVASMPGYDVPLVGWVALVPLFAVLTGLPEERAFRTALPFGLVFSAGVHNWYPSIFPPALGTILIFAVGFYYAAVLNWALRLRRRLPEGIAWLALPVTWAAVEFTKYVAPIVSDWWFVILADSQWRSPTALQILSVTGVFGLGFLVVLVNQAVAEGLRALITGSTRAVAFQSAVLLAAAAILGLSAASIPTDPRGFRIGVITDMANQDPRVRAQGEAAGTIVTSSEVSEAIFEIDAALVREAIASEPAFIVLPENELADADDPRFRARLAALARESGAYIVADMIWSAPTGLHDTAVMMDPTGREVLRRAKINVTPGEAAAGIVPGPADFRFVETPFGKASAAVCWDVHRLWIVRELARAGARIVLLPMDNDFGGVSSFPPFHAADAVFRAVENRVTIAVGSVNGLSMVVDPFGRITAQGRVNERGWAVGETFVVPHASLYTRAGDWFGWLMVTMLCVLVTIALTGAGRSARNTA